MRSAPAPSSNDSICTSGVTGRVKLRTVCLTGELTIEVDVILIAAGVGLPVNTTGETVPIIGSGRQAHTQLCSSNYAKSFSPRISFDKISASRMDCISTNMGLPEACEPAMSQKTATTSSIVSSSP